MEKRKQPGYTVLVVEDDPFHTHLIQLAFAREDPNASVSEARSAEEAIAYLNGTWPDTDHGRARLPSVIILDILMPGIGGLGFLEWFREQTDEIRNIPVVVFTSTVDPDLAHRCYALGAREVKLKPEAFPELVSVTRHILEQWNPGGASLTG